MHAETANVRYLIDDVPAAIAVYTGHLGFTLESDASPAFTAVVRGPPRLSPSGPGSSRATARIRVGHIPTRGGL